jgi:hypothetical protein
VLWEKILNDDSCSLDDKAKKIISDSFKTISEALQVVKITNPEKENDNNRNIISLYPNIKYLDYSDNKYSINESEEMKNNIQKIRDSLKTIYKQLSQPT